MREGARTSRGHAVLDSPCRARGAAARRRAARPDGDALEVVCEHARAAAALSSVWVEGGVASVPAVAGALEQPRVVCGARHTPLWAARHEAGHSQAVPRLAVPMGRVTDRVKRGRPQPGRASPGAALGRA